LHLTAAVQQAAGEAANPAGVATHCPYCALQCGMTLLPGDAGWTVAARDFPTNKGGLCRKGWTAATLLDAPGRLTSPLLRDGAGTLRPASWQAALDHVADAMQRIQRAHGRDAVAVAWTVASRSRWKTSGAPRRSCWSAATRPKRCRRSCSISTRSARAAAG
jgi:assimilatory nitrate reductase catalytic subunit